jgi:hypothetical protein
MATMTDTVTRKAFRVLGTTDDVTTCELCGRDELKGTVVLAVLDDDSNRTGEVVYYGAQCGAKAAGWTTRQVRDAAKAADRNRRDAEEAERRAKHRAWITDRDAWITANLGADALDNPRKYGFDSPIAVVRAYREATGN